MWACFFFIFRRKILFILIQNVDDNLLKIQNHATNTIKKKAIQMSASFTILSSALSWQWDMRDIDIYAILWS